ncbi:MULTISPECIES: ABC transporter substrate-binding protein [Bradyrhizobium]|uniref:ABC transporter substrate-binding protein n=1 Tax=Bradyrhizobium TaxID=374 RepID=UPI001CE24AD3|nr:MULTISPECIES: ABC transporter substrate-binding protein [Bradyrhizobium]MCA6097115.1 ABC transporter substrate-binding protein [Bradyrhizobium australafricanum]MCC8943923.1 ABC transporter substrate-binding protein [Bradyrhizobium brasilense]
MTLISRRSAIAGLGASALALGSTSRARSGNYGPGVTDTEIKLGTTAPYSGPASGYGVYGQAQTAYFQMINDNGGINGRKVNLISLDNAFSPPKAVEQTRKLVESEEVFAIAGFLGTAANAAVMKYLNAKKVPNLFLTSGAERFNDPKEYPWIVPFYPIYVAQGAALGAHIVSEKPDAKIAIQYVNDDLGKDFLRGLKKGLGSKAGAVVKEISHEITEPTIDNQVADCKAAGADVFVQLTYSKFAAQGLRKVAALGWKPLHIINSNCSSIGGTLAPAGLDNAKGLVSAWWEVIATDPRQQDKPRVKAYVEFMKKYMPSVSIDDNTATPGYNNAYMIEQVLRRCGNELTRENLLRHATSLKDEQPPLFLDGIKVGNSATDYRAVHNLQITRFDGANWVPIGDMVDLDGIAS